MLRTDQGLLYIDIYSIEIWGFPFSMLLHGSYPSKKSCSMSSHVVWETFIINVHDWPGNLCDSYGSVWRIQVLCLCLFFESYEPNTTSQQVGWLLVNAGRLGFLESHVILWFFCLVDMPSVNHHLKKPPTNHLLNSVCHYTGWFPEYWFKSNPT